MGGWGKRADQPLLHLGPRDRVQVAVLDVEGPVEEGLDLPELDDVVEGDGGPRHPEDAGDEHAAPGEQGQAGQALAGRVEQVRDGRLAVEVGDDTSVRVSLGEEEVVVHADQQRQRERHGKQVLNMG